MSGQRVPGRHQPIAARVARDEHRSTTDPDVSAAYGKLVDPEAVLRRVLAVNLSESWGANRGGRASTAADFGGPPGGLVAANNAWVRSQAPNAEETAIRKSRRRIVKDARKGRSAALCVARGYVRYVKTGGKLDLPAWTVAVST